MALCHLYIADSHIKSYLVQMKIAIRLWYHRVNICTKFPVCLFSEWEQYWKRINYCLKVFYALILFRILCPLTKASISLNEFEEKKTQTFSPSSISLKAFNINIYTDTFAEEGEVYFWHGLIQRCDCSRINKLVILISKIFKRQFLTCVDNHIFLENIKEQIILRMAKNTIWF